MLEAPQWHLPQGVEKVPTKSQEKLFSPPVCSRAEIRWLLALNNPEGRIIGSRSDLLSHCKSQIVFDLPFVNKLSHYHAESALSLCLEGPYAGYLCVDPIHAIQQKQLEVFYGHSVSCTTHAKFPVRPLYGHPRLPIENILRGREVEDFRQLSEGFGWNESSFDDPQLYLRLIEILLERNNFNFDRTTFETNILQFTQEVDELTRQGNQVPI